MNWNLTITILKGKIQYSLADEGIPTSFPFRNLGCRNLALQD